MHSGSRDWTQWTWSGTGKDRDYSQNTFGLLELWRFPLKEGKGQLSFLHGNLVKKGETQSQRSRSHCQFVPFISGPRLVLTRLLLSSPGSATTHDLLQLERTLRALVLGFFKAHFKARVCCLSQCSQKSPAMREEWKGGWCWVITRLVK